MSTEESIELFFSASYERDIHKMLLDDKEFIIPVRQVRDYVSQITSIPYSLFIQYQRSKQFNITSRDISQFSTFFACERELCHALSFIDNPGLSYDDIGKLFPNYVTSATDVAYKKYGENLAKTAQQLGLVFEYYGYWYLSCLGYVYESLDTATKQSLIARTLLRNDLYACIMNDILNNDVNLIDYMGCLDSDSTKGRRYSCVEYLAKICLRECADHQIYTHEILNSRNSLKKKVTFNRYTPSEDPFASLHRTIPINIQRRYKLQQSIHYIPSLFEKSLSFDDAPFLSNSLRWNIFFASIPLLSAVEERSLFDKFHEGDHTAFDAIVESILPFVVLYAEKYAKGSSYFDDLVQVGSMACMDAAIKFNPDYGFRFITYASTRIIQSIKLALIDFNNPYSFPRRSKSVYNQICKFTDAYLQENFYEPTVDEIADNLSISIDHVLDALKYHELVEESQTINDVENIYNEDSPPPIRGLINESLSREVDRTLHKLTQREADIIRKCHGIGMPEKTLDEIGDDLHLTRERVRQLKERAIRKIKTASKSNVLKTYLGFSDYWYEGVSHYEFPQRGKKSNIIQNPDDIVDMKLVHEFLEKDDTKQAPNINISETEISTIETPKDETPIVTMSDNEVDVSMPKQTNGSKLRLENLGIPLSGMISEQEAVEILSQPNFSDFNSGKAWSADLFFLLDQLYHEGKTIAQLQWKFGRSEGGILVALERMGLIAPYDNPKSTHYHNPSYKKEDNLVNVQTELLKLSKSKSNYAVNVLVFVLALCDLISQIKEEQRSKLLPDLIPVSYFLVKYFNNEWYLNVSDKQTYHSDISSLLDDSHISNIGNIIHKRKHWDRVLSSDSLAKSFGGIKLNSCLYTALKDDKIRDYFKMKISSLIN